MAYPLGELGISYVIAQTYDESLESMRVGTMVSEQDR